jgi:hypothetical protein
MYPNRGRCDLCKRYSSSSICGDCQGLIYEVRDPILEGRKASVIRLRKGKKNDTWCDLCDGRATKRIILDTPTGRYRRGWSRRRPPQNGTALCSFHFNLLPRMGDVRAAMIIVNALKE